MISIIVPAYNVEKHIEKTINSICAQTYSDLEIIIVDDGSKDNTLQIANEISQKDSRIKVYSKSNAGVTKARIFGVEQSNGEWIAFCDADDLLEPNMYEILLNNAIKYNADISHCGYNMVFPSRKVAYYGTKQMHIHNNEEGLLALIEGLIIEPSLCNKLFKRHLFFSLLKDNIFNYSIKINEDYLMNFQLFSKSNSSVFNDICLYNYIVHPESAANSELKEHHLSDPIKVNELILSDCKDNKEVYLAAKKRYINSLILTATKPIAQNVNLIKKYNKISRKQLYNLLIENIKTKEFSITFKLKIILATLLPDVYKFIHYIYSKITGLDKIYYIN